MKRIQVLICSMSFVLFVIGCKKHNIRNDSEFPPDPTPREKKWKVTTIAGDGRPIFSDGVVSTASFRFPIDVAAGVDGTLYVADFLNHRIRKIDAGVVTTIAGFGIQDTTNGSGANAGYSLPSRLVSDNSGNLYTIDFGDARVRKITRSGNVTTYAGTVEKGFKDGPFNSAQFNTSFGIAMDANGNIYIGDSGNKRIRMLNTNGQVITFAGNGEQEIKDGVGDQAHFYFPQGVVVDKNGNLFVADLNRIRKITPNGIVTTFAGNNIVGYVDGPRDQAQFTEIEDLVIDAEGNIYASDENKIRKITPQGIVSTIAGSEIGYQDGEGISSKFNGALGLGIDYQGNIYVADANNHRIRKISLE